MPAAKQVAWLESTCWKGEIKQPYEFQAMFQAMLKNRPYLNHILFLNPTKPMVMKTPNGHAELLSAKHSDSSLAEDNKEESALL